MSGGGSSTSSSSGYEDLASSSSTTLPSWLDSASQGAVSEAQQIAARPYTPYGQQLVADVPQDTQTAYQDVRNMQGMTNPAYDAAQNAWSGVLGNLQSLTPDQQNAITNALYSNYGQQVISPAASYLSSAYQNSQNLYGQAYGNTAGLTQQSLGAAAGLLSPYIQQGPATAQGIAQNAQTLMSPYINQVIDPTMQLGQQALAQNLQQVGASANQAGAFGGTRQGVEEGVAQAQSALQQSQYLGNLLNTGYNAALTPATQVALQGGQEAYGAAGLLSQMGVNAANTLGQQGYNTAAALGGFGSTAANTLISLLGGGYGSSLSDAQSLQSQNLNLGTTAAQQIPALAQAQADQAQKEASLMQTIGAAEQNQAQTDINAQLGQYYEAQDYPTQQLDTLLATLGAVPYGTSTTGTTTGYTVGNTSSTTSQGVSGTNVLGGAASGAALGSVAGPIGTGVGAVAGGILGALSH